MFRYSKKSETDNQMQNVIKRQAAKLSTIGLIRNVVISSRSIKNFDNLNITTNFTLSKNSDESNLAILMSFYSVTKFSILSLLNIMNHES